MTDVMSMFHSLKITNNSSEYVETNLDEKFQNFEEKCGSDHFVVQMWKTVSVLPVKTIKCVIGSLATTLDKVFTDDVLKNLSPEKEKKCFSISEFATQKSIIFINISPCNVNLHYLLNILYANIFNKLIELAENRGGVLNIPIQIVADDFACAGAVNNFQQYISIFRQAGISTLLLIQSEAQLENTVMWDIQHGEERVKDTLQQMLSCFQREAVHIEIQEVVLQHIEESVGQNMVHLQRETLLPY